MFKLEIPINTELIEFLILGSNYIGPGMVLGYFVFRLKSLDGFRLLFCNFLIPSKTESLDARGQSLIKRNSNRLILLYIVISFLSEA